MKNTLLLTYSANILVRLLTLNMKNCPIPKNQKMWDPILVIVLKMRPHYSHYRRENATPSSGTSSLASYKEVPPPLPREASLISRRHDQPFLVSVDLDVLKNCSVNHELSNPRLFTRSLKIS